MPRRDIWIRKENLDKWNKIPDKSNWVNTLLASSDDTSEYGTKEPVTGMIKVLSQTVPDEPIYEDLEQGA